MTKYIFVDLDETLFHTTYLGCDQVEPHDRRQEALSRINGSAKKLIRIPISEHRDDSDALLEYYASELRDGTHNFLTTLRAIPDSRVLVLTSSVISYARANNIAHALGFDQFHEIYAREDLQSDRTTFLTIPDPDTAQFYLIDNLSRHENRIKVRWIDNLTENAETNYIKVPEFWSNDQDRGFDVDLVQTLVSNILGNS